MCLIDQSNDVLQEPTIEGVGDDIARLLLTICVPEAEIKPEICAVPLPPVVAGIVGVLHSTGVPDTPKETNKRQYCDVKVIDGWKHYTVEKKFFQNDIAPKYIFSNIVLIEFFKSCPPS